MGLATLGYASVPTDPLNAAIALSILFLGVEVVRLWRGQTSLTLRQPWVVAFAFGLLHGFGFASGLTMVGLPSGDIPLALLCFNAGVELGQLAVLGVAASLVLLLNRRVVLRARLEVAAVYSMGALGAFWTIERVLAMFSG